MEVTAGSLYKAFPDKRAIFMSALERYVTLRQEKVSQRLAAKSSARDQIEALLSFYAESSSGAPGRQGCLVIESAVELSSVDPEVASKITQTLAKYQRRLEDLIRAGQQDGSIPEHVVPETVAPLLLCITQGMRVMGKAGRTAKQTKAWATAAMKLLD
jgi:AcrR family transcriptional regulator